MVPPMTMLIESPANPRFKLWSTLGEGRAIRKSGRFILAGRKTVPEALRRWPGRFEAVLARDAAQLQDMTLPDGVQAYHLSWRLFDELDVSGTKFPLLVGVVPDMPDADLAAPPVGLELLCPLGDPSNLGAVLRSAASFGATKVVLMRDASHPYHPKCLRAAANAPFELVLERGPAWDGLAAAAGPVLALDATGADIASFDWPRDLRLVVGEEGLGIPASAPLTRVAIPTSGRVESLNATVAASIALYDYRRRWPL
jgi:TrmH family RNA methyltransferase